MLNDRRLFLLTDISFPSLSFVQTPQALRVQPESYAFDGYCRAHHIMAEGPIITLGLED